MSPTWPLLFFSHFYLLMERKMGNGQQVERQKIGKLNIATGETSPVITIMTFITR